MKTAHDLVAAARARVQHVDLEDVDQAIREADVLLDVHEADECAGGHLSGAIHASRGMLEFKLSSDPELSSCDLKIALYCKTSGGYARACALGCGTSPRLGCRGDFAGRPTNLMQKVCNGRLHGSAY